MNENYYKDLYKTTKQIYNITQSQLKNHSIKKGGSESEITNLFTQIMNKNDKIQKLEAKISNFGKDMDVSKKDMDASKKELDESKKELAKIKTKYDELQAINKKNEDLFKKIKYFNDTVKQMEKSESNNSEWMSAFVKNFSLNYDTLVGRMNEKFKKFFDTINKVTQK